VSTIIQTLKGSNRRDPVRPFQGQAHICNRTRGRRKKRSPTAIQLHPFRMKDLLVAAWAALCSLCVLFASVVN